MKHPQGHRARMPFSEHQVGSWPLWRGCAGAASGPNRSSPAICGDEDVAQVGACGIRWGVGGEESWTGGQDRWGREDLGRGICSLSSAVGRHGRTVWGGLSMPALPQRMAVMGTKLGATFPLCLLAG